MEGVHFNKKNPHYERHLILTYNKNIGNLIGSQGRAAIILLVLSLRQKSERKVFGKIISPIPINLPMTWLLSVPMVI